MAIDVEEVAVRSGTTAEWAAAAAPVLALGEVGIDNTTGEIKVGDGTTAFALLVGATPAKRSVTLVGGTKATADTRIRAGSVIVPVHHTLGTVAAAKVLTVTRSAGVSYTITSTDATDTSVLDVLIWY